MRQILFVCFLFFGSQYSLAIDDWTELIDAYGCPQSRDYICNNHNRGYRCTCYRPNQYVPMRFESCDEIFRVVNVQAFVVEIRTKIPKDYPNFVEDFDIHFSEVVEDLLMIPQQYLVILRKRCVKNAMVVQIAFLSAVTKPWPRKIDINHLQSIHTRIFTENEKFMQQKYLPILNVSEVDHLTPVVRDLSETIIFNRETKKESNGILTVMIDISFRLFMGVIILIGSMAVVYVLMRCFFRQNFDSIRARLHDNF